MTWCTFSHVPPQVKRRGRSWSRNPEYVSTRQFIRQWLVKTTLGKNRLVPALALTYIAERGKGSYLNGERLALAGSGNLEVLIDNYPEPRGITWAAYTGLGFSRYIECGGISLKVCKVADGTADLFFKNIIVKDWDLAAPQLVLSEAGGVMKDIHGGDISYGHDYNHEGLIAAGSEEACQRLVGWYHSYEKEHCP